MLTQSTPAEVIDIAHTVHSMDTELPAKPSQEFHSVGLNVDVPTVTDRVTPVLPTASRLEVTEMEVDTPSVTTVRLASDALHPERLNCDTTAHIIAVNDITPSVPTATIREPIDAEVSIHSMAMELLATPSHEPEPHPRLDQDTAIASGTVTPSIGMVSRPEAKVDIATKRSGRNLKRKRQDTSDDDEEQYLVEVIYCYQKVHVSNRACSGIS